MPCLKQLDQVTNGLTPIKFNWFFLHIFKFKYPGNLWCCSLDYIFRKEQYFYLSPMGSIFFEKLDRKTGFRLVPNERDSLSRIPTWRDNSKKEEIWVTYPRWCPLRNRLCDTIRPFCWLRLHPFSFLSFLPVLQTFHFYVKPAAGLPTLHGR
jgi:hypothetical protein